MNHEGANSLVAQSTGGGCSVYPREKYLAAVAFIVVLTTGMALADDTNKPADFPSRANRRVQYGFTVQNTAQKVLPKAEFWTYAPAPRTATQVCRSFQVSHPYEVVADELGNQVLHIFFTNMAPFSVKIIRIEAELDHVDTPEVASVLPGTFLGAERLIEINDSAFGKLAPEFLEKDRAKQARAIYEWVASHIQATDYVARDRGALYALKEKKGDCTESMALFVALCRRNGIPARGIRGYVCTRSHVLEPAACHDWAEFHDGRAWQIADVQRKVFCAKASQHVAMHVMGSTNSPMAGFPRFRYAGEGLKVTMNQ